MAELQDVAREASSWFETARRATGDTETGPREDGEPYVRLREGAPKWMQDMVYDAHGDMLPDDWRYACIRSAVDWIADGNDPDDSGGFTGARFAWLISHLSRSGYVDEAADEFGAETVYVDNIVSAIGMGQYMEASEVFGYVLSAIEARAEETEEDSDDE